MAFTIQELLFKRGLSKTTKIKLVRHKSPHHDLYDKYKFDKKWFLEYQEEQHQPVFSNCEYIVSFLGEEGRRSRFIGVFKIKGIKKRTKTHYYYEIIEEKGFEDINERVIIDWGGSTRAWTQWIKQEKTIIEIQPSFLKKTFTDYLDFVLDFSELKKIVKEKDNFSDWHLRLSSVAGIYCILDKSNGKQYIGSASGDEGGILGRWKEYVNTNGHANNKLLKGLMRKDLNYSRYFQFTILMTLSKSLTRTEVTRKEELFKKKLGSRAFGLNLN